MRRQRVAARSRPRFARITQTPIAELIVNPGNARVHSSKQIRQIARSIAEFGFNVPILIDDSGMIVAGHGRLLASKELGLRSVPTIRLSHLTDAQKRAFAIAENRLVENAEWDHVLLAEQFAAIAAADLDFSLDVTGFELPEIDLMLQGASAAGQPDPDDAPIAPAPVVSRLGDVWQLGPHRVACGSSLDSTTYSN